MAQTTQDRIIAASSGVADAIRRAEVLDPPLAAALRGKALLYSKTVWGMLVTVLLMMAFRRWPMGLDPDTVNVLSGAIVMVVATGLRAITAGRVTSLLPPAPPEAPTVAKGA